MIVPTGRERTFGKDDIIVSKTDPKGIITYANQTFIKISGFQEEELLGAPHNLIRHPEMPKCVFQLMWNTIKQGEEIFAYVVNLCKNGDHYWVLAHVTPSFNSLGDITGYHSSRRVPEPTAIAQITPIYEALNKIEEAHSDSKKGMQQAKDELDRLLTKTGMGYDEFAFSLVTCA